MGNQNAKERKKEAAILRKPKQGEASELYWACRNGDVDSVRQIISETDYNQINCLEPNGSTALHAATYYGRVETVRILLRECGVLRHRRNRYGITAFDEAIDEDIRQLFLRPTNDRFCSNDSDQAKGLFDFESNKNSNDEKEEEETPNDIWVQGRKSEMDVQFHQWTLLVMSMMFNSTIMRALYMRLLRQIINDPEISLNFKGCVTILEKFFDEHVPSSHSEYQKAHHFLKQCQSEKKVELLLKIYTLETPFYRKLASEGMSYHLLLPILLKLPTIKDLAFRGQSFRGLSMSKDNLRAYQWAYRHKSSTLVTQTFCSTSLHRIQAEKFIAPTDDSLGVMIVFNFPEVCSTTIKLYRVSDNRDPISDIEIEKEVLVMPFTMFRVTQINEDNPDRYTICLENVPAALNEQFFTNIQNNPEALNETLKNFV